ncbi:MAG: hypothetical protein ACTS6G_06485 [Candidatus Hodgkinia cicadicola]
MTYPIDNHWRELNRIIDTQPSLRSQKYAKQRLNNGRGDTFEMIKVKCSEGSKLVRLM